MTLRGAALLGTLTIIGACMVSVHTAPAPQEPAAQFHFTEHVIDSGLTGGYQVIVADMNHDGRPDIIALASGLSELRWYENPGWRRHVIVGGIKTPINAAAYDVDGDGIPEIALAHGFDTEYAKSAGIVSLLFHTNEDIRLAYPYLEAADIAEALSYAAWRAEEVEVSLGQQ